MFEYLNLENVSSLNTMIFKSYYKKIKITKVLFELSVDFYFSEDMTTDRCYFFGNFFISYYPNKILLQRSEPIEFFKMLKELLNYS